MTVRTERDAVNSAGVSVEGEQLAAGGRVPELDRLTPAGGQTLAVRAEGQPGHTGRVAPIADHLFPRAKVPGPHLPRLAAVAQPRDQKFAVGSERHTAGPAGRWSCQGKHVLAG